MAVLETVAVAFAMFSALPVPCPVWNEKNLRYALCAFPLVGVVLGLGWWCWAWISELLGLGALARGAGFCLLPVLLTGGIHLDGYADTWDALASHGSRERKQEILKDPRCGAFAVIHLCVYFVAYLALCFEFAVTLKGISCAWISFMLSRALSGFAIAALPLSKDTGLAHSFQSQAHRGRVKWMLLAWSGLLAALLCLLGGWPGAAMAAAAGLVFWWYARMARRQFGGISGDLAGWFLQKAEFWMLAVLVLCQRLEGL